MFILDTDVLIDHLRGYPKAENLIEQFESGERRGYVSVVSVIELLAGRKIKSQSDVDSIMEFLGLFRKLDVTTDIAEKAGEFVRLYRCSIPDAIIAATAVALHVKIVTRNKKHYALIKEVEINVPYD